MKARHASAPLSEGHHPTVGDNLPDVSIVMPVFDAAPYLAASISSVLSQSRQDIELICVDDGSTDDSWKVLGRFAAADPRVRRIALPQNRGASVARNVGIEQSRGRYLVFLDADDELPPKSLQHLLSAAERTGCLLTMGVLDWRRSEEDAPSESPNPGSREVTTADVRESQFLQAVPGCHCCNLYARVLLDRHKIRYPVDLVIGEDQLFQATAIVRAGQVAIVDEVVYVYHHYRGSSLTRRRPDHRSLHDDVEYQGRIARLFKDSGLPRAASAYLSDWSYSIREYWLQAPETLEPSDATRLFTQVREVAAEFDLIEPWTDETPWPHQQLLKLIMEGDDERAWAFLCEGLSTKAAGEIDAQRRAELNA